MMGGFQALNAWSDKLMTAPKVLTKETTIHTNVGTIAAVILALASALAAGWIQREQLVALRAQTDHDRERVYVMERNMSDLQIQIKELGVGQQEFRKAYDRDMDRYIRERPGR